jgi:hypothetical protein
MCTKAQAGHLRTNIKRFKTLKSIFLICKTHPVIENRTIL